MLLMLEAQLNKIVQVLQNIMVRQKSYKHIFLYYIRTYVYTAQRNCNRDGSWDTVINVTECQSARLDMLSERIENVYSSAVININELSTISRDLSNITNTTGSTAIAPKNLNTTNNILRSLIRLA